jgi:hypothetical protein
MKKLFLESTAFFLVFSPASMAIAQDAETQNAKTQNMRAKSGQTGKTRMQVRLNKVELKGKRLFGFRTGRKQHQFGGGFDTENREATRYRTGAQQNLNFADTSIDKHSINMPGRTLWGRARTIF